MEVDHGVAELVPDADRPRAWTLHVDGTAQSHVDLDDPTHLEFRYVRRTAHVLDLLGEPGAPLRVLHLGGGAWTLPRYLAATRPGSVQRIAEIDGALAALVADRLPPDDEPDVVVGDARAVLRGTAGPLDVVVLDVFAGARTPAHLTTREFVGEVARVLAPGGVLLANIADGAGPAGPLVFARTQFAAAATAFGELAAVAVPQVWHGHRFGNIVLAASRAPLPVLDLARRIAGDPFPARVLGTAALEVLATTAPTDRTAVPSPDPPPGSFGR